MPQLPSTARVVIIGGGIAGCSAAYHLTKLGVTDVLLVERASLSSGTTWHSTGNLETYRDDPLIFDMVRYAAATYSNLHLESGQEIGWRNVGRVMYTDKAERFDFFRTLPQLGAVRGVEISLLTPAEVAQRLPIISAEGLVGGAWVPSDARVNPTDIVMAYARVAKAAGARFAQETQALEIITRQGRVCAVRTDHETVACETVIVAAGLWSAEVVKSCGLGLPLHPLEHQYIITKPVAGIARTMPLFLSYDDQLYGREEVGGLMLGSLDDRAVPVSPAELPRTFSFSLLNERWEQFEPYLATAMRRFPVLQHAEIKMLLNGPESFTPDGQMLLGPVPGADGLYTACGFNSNGIALAPAAGRFLAEWIVEGAPSADVGCIDVRRFAPIQNETGYLRARVSEVPSYHCRLHQAGDDYTTARNLRCSPIHSDLLAHGAHFMGVAGWERPAWYESNFTARSPMHGVAAEYTAGRNTVLIADRSSDAKFTLVGEPTADWLSAHMDGSFSGDEATMRLTALTGTHGEIEGLVRLVRLHATGWLVIAEPEQETRVREWLRKASLPSSIRQTESACDWAAFELVGPHREALLAATTEVTGEDSEGAAFIRTPKRPRKAIVREDISNESTLILVPVDQAVRVWQALLAAGTRFGLRLGGHFSREALRICAGAPGFGREATPAVCAQDLFASSRRSDFTLLRTAAAIQTHQGRKRSNVAAFSSPLLLNGLGGRDAVLNDGRVVGEITSRICLPGWRETLLLAVLRSEPTTHESLQILASGRLGPLIPRATRWTGPQ